MMPNTNFWRRNILLLPIQKYFIKGGILLLLGFDIMVTKSWWREIFNGFIFSFKLYLINVRFKSFIFQRIFCKVNFIRSGSAFLIASCNLDGMNRLLSFLFKILIFLIFALPQWVHLLLNCKKKNRINFDKTWIGIMETS